LAFDCAFELINTIYQTINLPNIEDDEESKVSILSDPNIPLLLDLMLLSNSEWLELETKCDTSMIHFDWLNSNTLFDDQSCEMMENELIAQDNCIPFVYSAVSTTYLLEKLIKDNSDTQLNNQLVEVIVSQLKHLFMASAYVSSKSKLLKSKDMVTISSILNDLLLNIIQLTEKNDVNSKIGQLLLEKLVKSLQINRNSIQFNSILDIFLFIITVAL